MKPIDEFFFVKGNVVEGSSISLMRCYYPIIGANAFSLYHFLVAFNDDGAKKHHFSEVLNHTMFGMTTFEEALAVLTAMNLVDFYQYRSSYLIQLKSPLSCEDFLNNALYRQLLARKIGEVAVDELKTVLPERAQKLSKRFSDVFDDDGQVDIARTAKAVTPTFDLEAFKNLMKRDGLSFGQEDKDTISLYRFAETHQLSWYDTYLLAKETAVDLTISLSRMTAKKSQGSALVASAENLTPQEQVIVKEARADRSPVFLAKVKKTRNASITYDERQLLLDLANKGFLDEVINIIILYTILKTDSANVNQKYALKIANDFAYRQINTAELAVLSMREFSSKKSQKTKPKAQKTNVPEWSNPNYQNQTSQEDKKRLEEAKRRALERLRKD